MKSIDRGSHQAFENLSRRNALRCIVIKAVHAQRPLQPDDCAFHRLQQCQRKATVSGK
jgi:hypothetical protein